MPSSALLIHGTGGQAAAGFALTFDAVYSAHSPTVTRWVARLGGPAVDLEDVVQEIFLVVSRRLPEFRGECEITTWLYRVTANVVANHRRRARLRSWLRLGPALESTLTSHGPTPAEELEQARAAQAFYRILDGLPEQQRRVLVLFELEGLSTEAIARLMEVKLGTVRVWLHRARARFYERQSRLGLPEGKDRKKGEEP